MDAMTQIAETLGSIPQTPQEKRAAKNRRYYERNRHYWQMWEDIRRLKALRDLLGLRGSVAQTTEIQPTYSRGEKNANAKINSSAVRAIRKDGRRASEVAADYGISACTVYNILSGKTWGHLV
jgi:hypothetical protein